MILQKAGQDQPIQDLEQQLPSPAKLRVRILRYSVIYVLWISLRINGKANVRNKKNYLSRPLRKGGFKIRQRTHSRPRILIWGAQDSSPRKQPCEDVTCNLETFATISFNRSIRNWNWKFWHHFQEISR